jgi:hypothetical protein
LEVSQTLNNRHHPVVSITLHRNEIEPLSKQERLDVRGKLPSSQPTHYAGLPFMGAQPRGEHWVERKNFTWQRTKDLDERSLYRGEILDHLIRRHARCDLPQHPFGDPDRNRDNDDSTGAHKFGVGEVGALIRHENRMAISLEEMRAPLAESTSTSYDPYRLLFVI